MGQEAKPIDQSINQLLSFIKKGTSPYHVVNEAAVQLEAAGFRKLDWDQEWKLEYGGTYYLAPFRTALFAFRVGESCGAGHQLRLISSHVDSPGLRIKAHAEYPCHSYRRINTEVYGGAINQTWMDRPLGMAGMVVLRAANGEGRETVFLDCGRPLFIVPNLSIHMNRDINKETILNPQIDMIPLAGLRSRGSAGVSESADRGDRAAAMNEAFFTRFLAEEVSKVRGGAVREEEIVSYDLCLYIFQEGMICGLDGELLAAPRLDNLTSVSAGITALLNSTRRTGLDVIALFDHEEIGSRSKNGGAGNLLPFALERIYEGLGQSRGDYLRSVGSGFLISADTAHALNPNRPEKYDPTSFIQLGDGVAIKCASKQNYAGDGEVWALIKELGEKNGIPCRYTFVRSDIPGGSTLGAILSAVLPMRTADIGVPLLAMHSAVESMSLDDQYYLEQLLTVFLSSEKLG